MQFRDSNSSLEQKEIHSPFFKNGLSLDEHIEELTILI